MDSLILSGFRVNMSNTAIRYAPLMGASDEAYDATETNESVPISPAGTLSKLYVIVQTAPGAGKSRTFTLMLDGSTTALVVTISGTNTTGSDTTNSVSVTAGQNVSLKLEPTSTPASSNAHWGVQFTGTTSNESALLGLGTGLDATSTLRIAPHGASASVGSSNALGRTLKATAAGTIKNLYVKLTTAPGAGTSRKFEVYKGGSATALTVTISGTATTGNDTSNSFTVVADDNLVVVETPTTSPATSRGMTGLTFSADTDGQFLIGASDTSVGTVDRYARVQAAHMDVSTAEADVQEPASIALTIKNIYAEIDVALGAGNTMAITLDKNASATALTTSISGASQVKANAASDISIASADLLSTFLDITGTPTAKRLAVGMMGFITPPAAGFPRNLTRSYLSNTGTWKAVA